MRKDDVTAELPGVPRRPGRPVTGTAMSAAARKRAQRARQAEQGVESVTVSLPSDVAEALRAYVARKSADDQVITQGQAIERILRDRLLRKR